MPDSHPTIELLHPEQVAAYRRMSSAERIAAGFAMTEFARQRLLAHFRDRHPDWTERQLQEAVAARFVGNAG
ncbi:MAG: hypothetical protein ACE5HQ_12040 [Gemmatimonadota bacterium]